MKSKGYRYIDWSEADDINAVQNLGELLVKLNINLSNELLSSCDEILSDDFCSACEYHNDRCACDENYGGRYMREYDDEASFDDY